MTTGMKQRLALCIVIVEIVPYHFLFVLMYICKLIMKILLKILSRNFVVELLLFSLNLT